MDLQLHLEEPVCILDSKSAWHLSVMVLTLSKKSRSWDTTTRATS